MEKDKRGSDAITLTSHLIAQQKEHKEATGDFTLLLTSIQTACKLISSKVRCAGLANIYGFSGESNQTGDEQKKLDIIANDAFINMLTKSGKCCILASEENDDAIYLESSDGNYIVTFDPLDGSSNIDVNISIGSIFGIWKKTDDSKPSKKDLFVQGSKQEAAGYCLYGSSTQLVLSIKNSGVNLYTLDPDLGEFILTITDLKLPSRGKYYSINEGNAHLWEEPITKYVHEKKFPSQGKPYSLRYVGTMVADVHRTLIYGGIFMYPKDKKNKKGKLRILYECFPMSFIMENAGGMSSTGSERILDIVPNEIHDRCPVIMGSKEDVEDVLKLYKA